METTAATDYLREANARIDSIQAQVADARQRAEQTDCPTERAEITKEIHQVLEDLDKHQADFLRIRKEAVS